MKECFEIVARERSKRAVSSKGLSCPKKTRRQQRSDQNRRQQINEQSDCIFQRRPCPFSGVARHLLSRKLSSGKARRREHPLTWGCDRAATPPQAYFRLNPSGGPPFRCLLRCSSVTDPLEDMLPPRALHAAKIRSPQTPSYPRDRTLL